MREKGKMRRKSLSRGGSLLRERNFSRKRIMNARSTTLPKGGGRR